MKHTVEHVTLNNPHDYQCRKYQWWCVQGCERYVKGECKPNYPMPAIMVGVDWVPSYRGGPYVVLFECRKVTNGRWSNTRQDYFEAID